VIEFRLDPRSGVPLYLQLVHQVRQGIRLGILQPGDQLPTLKEAVAQLMLNPNTVLHAYRQLDLEGLVVGRRGVGTFVAAQPPLEPIDARKRLRSSLEHWVARARAAELDDDAIAALFTQCLRLAPTGPVARRRAVGRR
jgi:GntR family transcriptional regulator